MNFSKTSRSLITYYSVPLLGGYGTAMELGDKLGNPDTFSIFHMPSLT